MRSQFELALERERQRELAEAEPSSKKRYIVGIREVHFRYFEVEAEGEEKAKDLVNDRAPGGCRP